MRRLTPNNASALRRIEFLRPAGTVEKIRVVQCGDHPDSSEVAFLNYLTSPQVGSVKAVAVADHDLYSSAPRGFDHCAAFGQAQGHRLFDQDMLACASRKFDVLYVKLMGSRDVNRLYIRLSAKLPDGFEGRGVEIGGEPHASLRAGVGGGDQFEFWMLRERRQHQHKAATQSRHAETQSAFSHQCPLSLRNAQPAARRKTRIDASQAVRFGQLFYASSTSSSFFARDTQIMMLSTRSAAVSTRSR